MKKILIALVIICFISGCTTTNIKLCLSLKPQNDIESFILPVKEGNKWVYSYKKGNIQQKVTYSILGLEEIFYKDNTNKNKSLTAYKILINSDVDSSDKTKDLHYYYKCDDAVQMLTVKNFKEKVVQSVYSIPEKPPVLKGDSIEVGSAYKPATFVTWKDPETITVPAGEFSCYVREAGYFKKNKDDFTNSGNSTKIISGKMYYCIGVGLVKAVDFDELGNIKMSYELESYVVK